MASKPITRSFSKSTLDSNAASTRPDSRQSTQSRRSSRFAQGQNDRRTSNMLSSELLTYLPETKVHDESNRNNGPETSKQNEIAASNDLLDSVENNQDTVSEKMEPWEWMQRKRRSSLIGIADTHGIWEEWQEYETKKVYYRNKLTGECQWSVPNSGIQAKTSQKSEKKKRKKEKVEGGKEYIYGLHLRKFFFCSPYFIFVIFFRLLLLFFVCFFLILFLIFICFVKVKQVF